LRAWKRGVWLVERTGFKTFKAFAFRSEILFIPLIPDGNIYNQTAISTMRQQSPQFHSTLYNQTAISTIELQSTQSDSNAGGLQSDCWDYSLIAEIAVWFWKWVKIKGPDIEASHWLRAQNRGLWLVERTGFKKFKTLAFHSEMSVIPLISDFINWYCQSDCNLHNQTAISAIRPQSQQSDCNLSNQNKTPSNIPDTLLGAGMCICKLRNFCNISNLTAISAIWLQSQQSDCNLSNQNKTQPATCLTPCWGPWHV
jgi:hypothetical protein